MPWHRQHPARAEAGRGWLRGPVEPGLVTLAARVGPLPWMDEVKYVSGLIVTNAGQPIALQGSAFLQVSFHGVDWMSSPYKPNVGAVRLAGWDSTNMIQLVSTDFFEGYMTWVVGLRHAAPFTVAEMSSPTRLVVDLAGA